ncbi:MAG: 2-C-methyl-D-erythritol 4-phosphate cytidylyltransferase [Jatrophihabitans sp.]
MTVGALLLAAGAGERLARDRPKALCEVGGRTLLEHSLSALRAHPSIGAIVVTAPADHAQRIVELTAGDPFVTVISGGRTRQDSVRLGLGVLAEEADVVLVHDAARPFITGACIDRVLAALEAGADAAVPAVPVTDTIKRIAADGAVVGTVDRGELRAVQTPQGFRRTALAAAHQFARMANLHDVSDDAGLIERHGGRVVVVDGDAEAFKITRPLDLALAELTLRSMQSRP